MPFDRKLRRGFELYHRQRHGYYPTWDAKESRFAVRSAQDKWALWELFFQSRHNQVIAISSALDMTVMYLDTIDSKCGNVAELVEGAPLVRERSEVQFFSTAPTKRFSCAGKQHAYGWLVFASYPQPACVQFVRVDASRLYSIQCKDHHGICSHYSQRVLLFEPYPCHQTIL